jgi:methionine aminotransferase
MSAMAQEENAINLSQGFPDFPVDPELGRLLNEAFEKGLNQYPPMAGRLGLREQLAAKIKTLYQVDLDPEREITITAGATEALFNAFACLLTEGDEAILFAPAYDSYDPVIRLFGAKARYSYLHAPHFRPDWEEVEEMINDKTRLIVINSPHNPTGSVLRKEDMEELKRICLNHGLWIISDEVYEHLIFDGLQHHSVLEDETLRYISFAIFSFGKTFHATGWKIGYAVAPPELSEEFRKIHQFNTFSVNHTAQYALEAYMAQGDQWSELGSFYQRKRDLFAQGIKNDTFELLPCHGTYFQSMRYNESTGKGDREMAEWLTRRFKIASIPLSPFYPKGENDNLLRFCFAKEDSTLKEAVERINAIQL